MQTADKLTDAERDQIRSVILADGLPTVARWMRVGRDSLARAVAGLSVRRGTVALIRARMQVPTAAKAATP